MARETRLGYPIEIQGSDGNRIACQVDGPPGAYPIILTSGIGCGPVFFRFIGPELAKKYRIIFWDFRAHGRSDFAPDGKSYQIEDHARDLEAIVRKITRQPPFMISFSMGVQVTLEWIKRFGGDNIPGYVFLLGTPSNPLKNHWFWGSSALRKSLDGLLFTGGNTFIPYLHPLTKTILRNRLSYAVAVKTGLVTDRFSYEDYSEFIHYSSGVRPDAYLRTATGVLDHSALDIWNGLEAPVLYIASEKDFIVPTEECRTASKLLIKSATYEEIEAGSHAGMVEARRALADRIVKFVDENIQILEEGELKAS